MNNKRTGSLSRNIVISIALIFLVVMTIIFIIFERTNREAFAEIEREKAELIADTIEPVLALNIFLGLDEKISQLTRQLLDNPNILSVKITREGEVVYDVTSVKDIAELKGSFLISKEILQPNSPKSIGILELVYSNEEYNRLINKYTNILVLLIIAITVIFILYGFYVRRLFSPLKDIASLLRHYKPEHEIVFPNIKANNEIGLIANALNDMQFRILEYSRNQKDVNRLLEEKVQAKTEALRNQLYIDALTGLPNRVQIIEHLMKVDNGALILINIDDFKEINDFFGHIAGDAVLIEFSQRLGNLLDRNSATMLYRLSGDEFALLIDKTVTHDMVDGFINTLVNNIENMLFFHENNELSLRVTIGASLQMDAALEKADIALKKARKERKSSLVYHENLNVEKQYEGNLEWIKKLKDAIQNDAIIPYYQPIYDKNGRIASYESLIRMRDINGDIISPFFFLDVAKKSRLYTKLTKIMVEKSCRHFEAIDCSFSINLSVEDILNDDVVHFIKETVARYNVSEKIIFEILESEGIENYKEVAHFITEMKELGCHIAIDDFGSGYSNFDHLLQLDIDYIKIDGTLIKNIDTDPNAQIVVETIVDFANRLHIWTVAEFVHSPKVYEKVKRLGIDRFQGYYLGEPRIDTSYNEK
jgi:diguanylate cyclase (GGDEF)-like protein